MSAVDLSIRPDASDPHGFDARVAREGSGALRGVRVTTLQVNVTARCNLACHHCHVESGPKRSESMDEAGAERILALLASNPAVQVLDLTGGAPELNPHFRRLVQGARALGRRVIDRCNITVLFEPGQEDTAIFLADNQVEIVASLPCYTAENVEQQRGRGVFPKSIEGLQALCALGYGRRGSGLELDLVYNPVGAFLPPPQDELEARYRSELFERYGIVFGRLIAITNMPIKRFRHELERDGGYREYLELLCANFNPTTLDHLMCRSMLSVRWDGALFDCDFNQQLEIRPPDSSLLPATIWDVDDLDELTRRPIATAAHCFGCTAGKGSSCGGSLTGASLG